ncbi:MAG: helix-turn-helix transcriptional regulator [Sulfitobacter sp.]
MNVTYIAWLNFVRRGRLAAMKLRDRVALNIQDLRRARDLSQEELALRSDVSRGHMGKVENAKFAASLDLLERIAKALDVDPSALFHPR